MTGGKDSSGCMEVQPWCGARERKANFYNCLLERDQEAGNYGLAIIVFKTVEEEWRAATGHKEK